MQKSEFLQILRICKTFDKRKEKENKNQRLVELHKDVIKLIMDIDNSVRLRNVEKVESTQAALEIAWSNAEKAGVTFTDDEKTAYDNAMLASTSAPIRKKGTPEHTQARIERAEAAEREALAKAEAAEAAMKAQAEKAEKLQAEAKQAAEAREEWKKERERLAKHNAELHVKIHEAANKYNSILETLKKIPKDCSALEKDQMKDLLETIAKAIQ